MTCNKIPKVKKTKEKKVLFSHRWYKGFNGEFLEANAGAFSSLSPLHSVQDPSLLGGLPTVEMHLPISMNSI